MQITENGNRLLTARKGRYNGKKVTITHRDPRTGNVWLDDYPIGKNPITYGCWVKEESVKYD